MELITVDDYTSKCTMIVNGIDTDIIFCRNNYGITFIYYEKEMISVFIPEELYTKCPDIAHDIVRLYGEKVPIISMKFLNQISFSYGVVMGMILKGVDEVNVD